ncbi:TPA: PIN-like domain-containing protein [Legionella pneumophila]
MSNKLSLFMDANIFLNFYSYSKDEIDTLAKLYGKLCENHFQILITELLEDEFFRRRENRFKEVLDSKVDIKISIDNIPVVFSNEIEDTRELNDARKNLKKASKEYSNLYYKILKKIKYNFSNNTLFPDELISRIFKKAKKIDLTQVILEKAKSRTEINNPPGNKNELCDRIHWESLLYGVDDSHDLVIISNDSSFKSVIDSNINPFLQKEWNEKKQTSIEIFKTITDFSKAYFPEFELQSEVASEIKNEISLLKKSNSFSETHIIIEALNRYYENLTRQHIKQIIMAYKSNNQIYGIITDEDVKKFLLRLKEHKNYDDILNSEVEYLLEFS